MTRRRVNANGGEQSPREYLGHIMQLGQQASQLLQSDVYNWAYQELMMELHAELLATEPKEERKRESLYHEAKALTRISERLAAYVEHAQNQAQQGQPAPDAIPQPYQETDGFFQPHQLTGE